MNSFKETKRQLRIALIIIGVIIPSGVIGFMILEDLEILDAIWLTITTLTTIGYGNIVAISPEGRIFTLALIVFGLGAYAMVAQASVQFLTSPAIRDTRKRHAAERKINELRNHYIICGEGEMVDQTINYLRRRASLRLASQKEKLAQPIDRILAPLFGSEQSGLRAIIRNTIKKIVLFFKQLGNSSTTLLDVIVVVTNDKEYANRLQEDELLVIQGDPSDDSALQNAGIKHSKAMMVVLEDDMETLLTVLTARSLNPDTFITASAHSGLGDKMLAVGANNVLAPYEVAGRFLNNATLRPAVNMFFSSILFSQSANTQIVQLFLWEDSPWIGQTLGDLNLRKRHKSGVIGLRCQDGSYLYAPSDGYILQAYDVILTVTPAHFISDLQRECHETSDHESRIPDWRRSPSKNPILVGKTKYTTEEAEKAVQEMSKHYIICGDGIIINNSLADLDPKYPFVFISEDDKQVDAARERGFRVIYGNPSHEETLQKAGVKRALAIMVSMENKANAILTILNCRDMNESLLITATAKTDDMIAKLRRAGADRVVSPFRIAAQFVLMATTRPAVSDFMQYVLYNYQANIETTELYTQNNSQWIGKTIKALNLRVIFDSGVIGIRKADGSFIYAPDQDYVIGENEVLIVTTPMKHSEELRMVAHGTDHKRPESLRHKIT